MKQWYLEGINALQYVFSALQSNEILQYIEFGVSILTSIILIGCRIWHWYKSAKKDGKIDEEEIDELVQIAEEELDDLKNKEK